MTPAGELLIRPGHERDDLRLLKRIIDNGWEFPEGMTRVVPAEVLKFMIETTTVQDDSGNAKRVPRYGERIRLRAAAVLQSMMAHNQRLLLGEETGDTIEQHFHIHNDQVINLTLEQRAERLDHALVAEMERRGLLSADTAADLAATDGNGAEH